MRDFKIGDKVTAKEKNKYTYTNSDSICKIVKFLGRGDMMVKILEHKNIDFKYKIGTEWNVEIEDFKLISKSFEELLE
jgi:hypothetical protein